MSRSSAVVVAPSSKSFSHRKMIAAALAGGVSRLTRVLVSDDLSRTIDVLRIAGAGIDDKGEGTYTVTGMGGAPRRPSGEAVSCFMGESGTSCRLLTAVLAAGQGTFRIHGAERLHERPMRDLTDALTTLGADLQWEGRVGHLPLVMEAGGLAQPDADPWLPVCSDISSQFLSGLLLAAPLARTGLGLALSGSRAVSWPYVALTLQTLEQSGLSVSVAVREETRDGNLWQPAQWRSFRSGLPGNMRFRVEPGAYQPLTGDTGVVEGDYSGASYLLAAGAVGPGPVTVTGLVRESIQGDAAILGILTMMGASVAWHDGAVTVSPGPLQGIRVNMADCPDLVPTVAVLAALASGETTITGVPHLREKECDRLAAPAQELARIGCAITVLDEGLHITPPARLVPGRVNFCAHGDHRMAMSLALLERAGIGVTLDTPGCVAKSFPAFWQTWRTITPPVEAV